MLEVNPGVSVKELVLLLAILASPTAMAQEDRQIVEPRTVYTLRVQPPLLGFASAEGVLVTDVSASLRFLHVLEVGAGLNASEAVCNGGTSTRIQAGLVPGRDSPLPPGAHWSLRVPLLAGYTNYSGTFGVRECGQGDGQASAHEITGATGIDATRWGHSGVGFNLRFLVSGGAAWRTKKSSVDAAPRHSQEPFFTANLTVGISFGQR